MKKKKQHKREALKIATYEAAFRIALKHGRKYGITREEAKDIASAAYLVKARHALPSLRAKVPSAAGYDFAAKAVKDELRKFTTGTGGFERGEAFIRLDDSAHHITISEGGRTALYIRRMCDLGPDPVPPPPRWQIETRALVATLPPDLKRIAKAFTRYWTPEKAREKVKMNREKFYRLKKKLKLLLEPCFIGFRAWSEHRKRAKKSY